MAEISIIPQTSNGNVISWRTIAGEREAIGGTAGEALDGLTAQLENGQNGMFVLYEQWQPDEFFNASQQQRLSVLMARWRAARDTGQTLPDEEQRELEAWSIPSLLPRPNDNGFDGEYTRK